ncbi:hypothetical protein Fot_37641 [Forsythia ovata]|uniref:Uncharacterized protein n=1 Tax=Forsythia ovata TaxID=205694 RepID=A0ABD1S3N2_9LAMI
MARARDNHTQQRYNHEGQANAKSSDDIMRHQIGRSQGTHHHPFPGIGSTTQLRSLKQSQTCTLACMSLNQGMAIGQAVPANIKSHSPTHTAPTIDSTNIVPRTSVTYRHW